MKALKTLLIAVVALLALLFGVGLLLSPKFVVSRSVTVNAPPEKIYALIADPRGWTQWSAWNQRDPKMTIEYSGPASGAGAVWALQI